MYQNARAFLLAGIVAMVTALPVVRAEEAQSHKSGPGCSNCGSAPVHTESAAPCYKEVEVTKCVPEWYTEKQTCYKNVKVAEKYTAYKCVSVPEQRTREVTCYKTVQVPETYKCWKCITVPETRTRNITCYKTVNKCKTVRKAYCVKVPVVEHKTVMKKHWVTKTETYFKTKTVDNGHWETKCVEVKPGLWSKFKGSMKGMMKKKCDPCDPCCVEECDCPEPPKFKTKKVWVSCKQCIQVPCTRTRKVCEYRPETKKVCSYRTETRYKDEVVNYCEKVPFTKCETYTCNVQKKVCEEKTRMVCKKVPYTKTETYCVNVQKKVPYEATRWVCKRVPHEVEVKKCRMRKVIEKVKVPVCPTPCDPCADPCGH